MGSMSEKSRAAETTCGCTVSIDGEIDLTGDIDGNQHTTTFKDMQVSMPVASMRKTIKAGNDSYITENRSTIKHRKSGKTIQLHERCDVFFIKMSLMDHDQQPQKSSKPESLGRPT